MSAPLPIDDLKLERFPETGKPTVSRLKDVKSALELYQTIMDADEDSAANRAAIQAMFDGEAPYDQDELDSAGMGNRTNLNFDEASALLEHSLSGYVDAIHSVETLVTVKTRFGQPQERARHEEIIAQEISRTIRDWPGFNYQYLRNCHNFISQGVSVSYFENEFDWRWNVAAFGEFGIPRGTKASEEEIEVAVCPRSFQVHQLYKFIANEEVAASLGWNVTEVRKALTKASAKDPDADDWEKIQEELKNNDIHSGVRSATVDVVHFWVKEFDGSVSHFIAAKDGGADFLYKKLSRFSSAEQAYIFFTYGIGTNGTYHSIRGLGHKIYPHINVSNRLRSQAVDAAMLATTVLVTPKSEEAAESPVMIDGGTMTLLPPNFDIVQRPMPNLSTSVVPVLQDLNNQIQNKTGQYTQGLFNDTRERTRFEVSAQLEQLAKLSVTAQNLFYQPWQRLMREVVRRLTNRALSAAHPGGKEAQDFRRRCLERGVPAKAIDRLDVMATKAVRAIGAGSQAARQLVLEELAAAAPAMDEFGRNRVLRSRLASRVGWEEADMLIPPLDTQRPTDDERFAEAENNFLRLGMDATVRANDLHMVHLRVHMGVLDEYSQQIEVGEAQLIEVTPLMLAVHKHSTAHLAAVVGDPTVAEESSEARARLQRYGEFIYNGLRAIQTAQRKAAEEGAAEGGQPAQSPEDVKMTAELIRSNLKLNAELAHQQEKHALQMQQMAEKNRLEIALADAREAAALRRKSA